MKYSNFCLLKSLFSSTDISCKKEYELNMAKSRNKSVAAGIKNSSSITNLASQEELLKVQDELVKELVHHEVENGLQVVSDGEFGRSWWHLDFL